MEKSTILTEFKNAFSALFTFCFCNLQEKPNKWKTKWCRSYKKTWTWGMMIINLTPVGGCLFNETHEDLGCYCTCFLELNFPNGWWTLLYSLLNCHWSANSIDLTKLSKLQPFVSHLHFLCKAKSVNMETTKRHQELPFFCICFVSAE